MMLHAPPPGYDRVLHFRRIANFRDLGGYPTQDGRHVKWGVLYRAGHLAKAASDDLTRLETLGLHTVVDFRSQSERDRLPDRLPPDHTIRQMWLPVTGGAYVDLVNEMRERFEANDYDDFDPGAAMLTIYRDLAQTFRSQYRDYLHAVLDAGGEPVLCHCTAGKDRTGFAAALLLRLLGVPDAIVRQDYMLSNEHVSSRRLMLFMMRLMKREEAASAVEVMRSVRPEWLNEAFTTVETNWGSFDAYRREALELTDDDVTRLQTLLLHE